MSNVSLPAGFVSKESLPNRLDRLLTAGLVVVVTSTATSVSSSSTSARLCDACRTSTHMLCCSGAASSGCVSSVFFSV
jgi:hypothetical protein